MRFAVGRFVDDDYSRRSCRSLILLLLGVLDPVDVFKTPKLTQPSSLPYLILII